MKDLQVFVERCPAIAVSNFVVCQPVPNLFPEYSLNDNLFLQYELSYIWHMISTMRDGRLDNPEHILYARLELLELLEMLVPLVVNREGVIM